MLGHASPIALRRTLTSRDHRWLVGIGVAVLLALVLLAHSPIGAGHMDMADATPAHAQAQMCLATIDGGHALVPLSAPLVVLTRAVKPANVRISAVAYRPAAMTGGPARAGPAFLCVDRR
jgi:zona occludens toxin (predicted ATPase)